jgi:copper chaperone
MGCSHCVNTITGALSKTAGITSVAVCLATKQVTADYDENTITETNIVQIIEDLGYTVENYE